MPTSEIIGHIEIMFCGDRRVDLEWRIPEFFSLPAKVSKHYSSPDFKCLTTNWSFDMYPNGDFRGEWQEWIFLAMWKKVNMNLLTKYICFSLGFRTTGGTEERIICNHRFPENYNHWGPVKFLKRSELLTRKTQKGHSGGIIITCTLWSGKQPFVESRRPVPPVPQVVAPKVVASKEKEYAVPNTKDKRLVSRETQTDDLSSDIGVRDVDPIRHSTKGGAILRKHFKHLLLSGQKHDVTLKVKNKEFKAHEVILAARSPVFTAMFAHNMQETGRKSVSIEDCDPGAFGEFLQYIYTGAVENITPSTAIGLYYAGDKYDFPELKEICLEYLKTSLSASVVSDVITLALKHSEDELLNCAVEFFSKHLEEILMTVEWQRFFMLNPMQANELYIKALKSSYKKIE